MLSQVEAIQPLPGTSLVFTRRIAAQFDFAWHHHVAFELTLIDAGSGRRVVGDSIAEYSPGDFVLIGEALPHSWASHITSADNQEATVAQFQLDPFGEWPELGKVRKLLGRAACGLAFGADADRARARFRLAETESGLARWIGLLEVLSVLAELPAEPLASSGWLRRQGSARRSRHAQAMDARIDAVYQYVERHLHHSVPQHEVAAQVGMSPASFSRFFKRSAGMTYSRYVQELRVGEACRLLSESSQPITQIVFDVGFDSIPHFNRVFKNLKDHTPSAWRQAHRQG